MESLELAALLTRFAEPADRTGAAAELARRIGVDGILAFVRDPELGVLLPAPGFPQTVAGGPAWRAFIGRCITPGVHTGEVDYPRDQTTRATAHVSEKGDAFVLFGGPPDDSAVATLLLHRLPLVAALLRAEHVANLARGEAEVSRAGVRHAKNLAVALDGARGELERALVESARLNDELKHIDRRKDDFLAMLGHELRNPMAAISGAIEVMRARPEDLEQIGRARAIIERQAEQLARLVDDLLDVARIARGKIALRLEPVDVEGIARRALEATHPLAEAKRHDVAIEVRQRVHARADRTRLEQMIANLLTNAIKYTDPGGRIVLLVDRVAGEAVVKVTDNGIGIAHGMLPRVFEPFLQVDASLERGAGGLGVGLTVVSRLAGLQHGRVHAESTLGKGSTFTIQLPCVEPEEIPMPPPSTIAEAAVPAAKKRVLIVDDNADSAEMMVALAENWGHDAFHASDGPRAVTLAHEQRPDLVLLDIGLPGMDGYEVAARLRGDPRTRGARIVAVSGFGGEADRLRSRAAGCDEHLVKPVDFAALSRVLKS